MLQEAVLSRSFLGCTKWNDGLHANFTKYGVGGVESRKLWVGFWGLSKKSESSLEDG